MGCLTLLDCLHSHGQEFGPHRFSASLVLQAGPVELGAPGSALVFRLIRGGVPLTLKKVAPFLGPRFKRGRVLAG